MALPYLPHEQIQGTFYELKALANDHPLEQLCTYVERQWNASNFYKSKRWSIFQKRSKQTTTCKKGTNTILSLGQTSTQGGVICYTSDKTCFVGEDNMPTTTKEITGFARKSEEILEEYNERILSMLLFLKIL